jgi:serine/threonine-protein kinase SRPK3
VERLDGNPNGPEVLEYCVPPALIFESSEEIAESQIIISDFGEAFFQNEKRKELHAPILLLPPEVFFGDHAGPVVDIWTLGCTLYEIVGERPLFEGFMPDRDHVLAEMVSTLGHLPKRWWEQWQQKTDFFLEDGSWKTDTHRSHAPYSRPLAERLRIMGRGEDPATCEFSREEMASFETLLREMLAYEPSERITTDTAIESGWMKGWGRPAMIETGVISR